MDRVRSERFSTTAWTVVSRARSGADSEAREALAFLCAAYWRPLYSFARRLGHATRTPSTSRRDTSRCSSRRTTSRDVRLREGRFRAFLLTSFRHFLSKERDRARALKRGGGRVPLSIDAQEAEGRHADEPLDTLDPEALFERRWALTILERAMARLRPGICRKRVGAPSSSSSKRYLTGSEPGCAIKRRPSGSGRPRAPIKKMVHRLRRRYGHAAPGRDRRPRWPIPETSIRTASPAVGRQAVGAAGGVTFLLASVFRDLERGDVDFAETVATAARRLIDRWCVAKAGVPEVPAGPRGRREPGGSAGDPKGSRRRVRPTTPWSFDPPLILGGRYRLLRDARSRRSGRGVARLRCEAPRGSGAQGASTGSGPRRSRAGALAA